MYNRVCLLENNLNIHCSKYIKCSTQKGIVNVCIYIDQAGYYHMNWNLIWLSCADWEKCFIYSKSLVFL